MKKNLLEEWDYEMNEGIDPNEVSAHSAKKFRWICKVKGHRWSASMDNRSNGSGCPYCSNNKVSPGDNDLTTVNEELAEEWDYEKNEGLTPMMFTRGSGKKVWWKCKVCGRSWVAMIRSRTSGCGCPYCNSNRIQRGTNDLATVNRELAEEWDYERNRDLLPSDVTEKSSKDVWWICKRKRHRWHAKVYRRVAHPECPYCSGRRAIPYETDFMTLYPQLKQEWDENSEWNKGINPYEIIYYKGKKYGWKCVKGHVWRATVSVRIKGSGCPYCAQKKAIKGENDLESLRSDIALEWNYEKNGSLLPSDVMCGTSKIVWWICKLGHEWQASIYNRTKVSGTKCPYCAGKKAISGMNDLFTECPRLREEWDWERNRGIDSRTLLKQSHKKLYWVCEQGHSWRASANNRSRGTQCPVCQEKSSV